MERDWCAPQRRLALGFGGILLAIALAVVAWHMPGRVFQPDEPVDRRPTIVVLPLMDMSAAQNAQALCDGLTEELSNWLAHIPSLRVVAHTSAFAFKGLNTDVRDIARKLGASHVLQGSVRRAGEQLRLTVQSHGHARRPGRRRRGAARSPEPGLARLVARPA